MDFEGPNVESCKRTSYQVTQGSKTIETLVQFIRNTSQPNESAVYNKAIPYPFAQRVFLPHSKGHSSQITAATDSLSLSLSISPSHGSNVINQPAPSNSLVLVQFVFRDSPHCVVITSISDLHYTYEQYEIKKKTEWTCLHASRPTPTDLQRMSPRKRIGRHTRPILIPTLIIRTGMWQVRVGSERRRKFLSENPS